MRNPLVMYVVSETTCDATHGKFLFGAEILRRAGMDPLIFTWSQLAMDIAKQKQFFACTPLLEEQPMTADLRIAASKEAWELLGWPISQQKDAPTWSRLLALDDVLGGVQSWRYGNLDILRPDVIVKSSQGAESSTPKDEQMDMVLGRWATVNQIPVVAVEVQRVDDVLALKWPVRVVLTRQDVLAVPYAEGVWRLPPAQRHLAAIGDDPQIEGFLEQEAALREKFKVTGKRVIFIPFHLYYVQGCIELLRELSKYARELEGWAVVVGCGEAYRRSYKERDVIERGLVQAWSGLGNITIAENVNLSAGILLADIVAVPYRSAAVQLLEQKWGLNVWYVGRDFRNALEEAGFVKGLAEAVRGVLPNDS